MIILSFHNIKGMASNDKSKNDPFWYEDPNILIQQDRLIEFFPHNDMTLYEKLNAIVRFAVYFALVVYAFKRQTKMFFFPLFVVGLTIFLFKNGYDPIENFTTKSNNPLKSKFCQQPSDNNPFMNVLISDYTENPQKKPACDVNDKRVKKAIKDKFENNLYKNTVDIWGRNNSQREYYTMPNTTIPNDQINFANWLYKTPPTCKELTTHCTTEIDIRHNRRPIDQLIKDGR
jgi:hypothetical protein